MRHRKLIGWTLGVAGLAASAGFTGAVVGATTSGADAPAPSAPAARGDAAVETVLARLREAGYTTVLEIEREDGGYEAKVLDAAGRRHEVYLDARGVPLMAAGRQDEEHDGAGRYDDHRFDEPRVGEERPVPARD